MLSTRLDLISSRISIPIGIFTRGLFVSSVILQPLTCDADQELKWKLKLNVAQTVATTQTRQNEYEYERQSKPIDEQSVPSVERRAPSTQSALPSWRCSSGFQLHCIPVEGDENGIGWHVTGLITKSAGSYCLNS